MTIQEHLAWDQIIDDNLRFFKAIGGYTISLHSAPPEIKEGHDRAAYWKRRHGNGSSRTD